MNLLITGTTSGAVNAIALSNAKDGHKVSIFK